MTAQLEPAEEATLLPRLSNWVGVPGANNRAAVRGGWVGGAPPMPAA